MPNAVLRSARCAYMVDVGPRVRRCYVFDCLCLMSRAVLLCFSVIAMRCLNALCDMYCCL